MICAFETTYMLIWLIGVGPNLAKVPNTLLLHTKKRDETS